MYSEHLVKIPIRRTVASHQIFPSVAFLSEQYSHFLIGRESELYLGYSHIQKAIEADHPVRFHISGKRYSGRTTFGHDFCWYGIKYLYDTQPPPQFPKVIYVSAYQRTPKELVVKLLQEANPKIEIPSDVSSEVLLSKFHETFNPRSPLLIFVDDLDKSHTDVINEFLFQLESAESHIFLSTLPKFAEFLHPKAQHQLENNHIHLPDVKIRLLAKILQNEANKLHDIPLTAEQALYFAEIDHMLVKKMPIPHAIDRPFIKLLQEEFPGYRGKSLTGNTCRHIAETIAAYQSSWNVQDLTDGESIFLERLFENLIRKSPLGKCFVDLPKIYEIFVDELGSEYLPSKVNQQEVNRILAEQGHDMINWNVSEPEPIQQSVQHEPHESSPEEILAALINMSTIPLSTMH